MSKEPNNFNELLGTRIKARRESLELTQQEVANACGFGSPQIVSQLESGERSVKAAELSTLARCLRTTFDKLLDGGTSLSPNILWRNEPAESERNLVGDELTTLAEKFAIIERLTNYKAPSTLPQIDIDLNTSSPAQISNEGEEISQRLGLGNIPAVSLVRTLSESFGIKIFFTKQSQPFSAASMAGDFGFAVFIDGTQAPWRRNFSLGHELFHLMTWSTYPPENLRHDLDLKREVERFANAFSSGLLLPAAPILQTLDSITSAENKISYVDLINLARQFCVSTEALLWRLCNLKRFSRETVETLLNSQAFRDLDKGTMAEEWNEPSIDERFVRLGCKAYWEENISKARLADILDCRLIDLDDFFERRGMNLNGAVGNTENEKVVFT